MPTATIPTDLHALSDEALVQMVAEHGDDPALLDLLLAELDTRDADHEPTEQERLRDLVQQQRRPGESLDSVVMRLYEDELERWYVDAENACRGKMLSKEGERAGVDPGSLFRGSARTAAKYASRELIEWWMANGRTTWIEYQYLMLGRPGDAACAAAAARATQDYIR